MSQKAVRITVAPMKKIQQSRKGSLGLREIAEASNVSIATVSRVLNGTGRVDAALHNKVMAAAAKLKFEPSARKKSSALVFLLSNRSQLPPFHARILVGAEAYCSSRGWDLFFLSFDYPIHTPARELHLPKLVQRRDLVRGVILAGNTSPNLLQLLEEKQIPYVVLGNNIMGGLPDMRNDVIFSDEERGGEDMARYLISLGHKNICFVGNTRLPWFARYYEGYRRAMEQAGLEPVQSSIDSDDDIEIGYLGAKYMLSTGRSITAIFAGNDSTACGVYKGLREQGLRIPEDISVAACNDTVGSLLYPGLTTVREFPEQVGRHMAELLLDRIANPKLEPRTLTIPTEFIKRDSCRALQADDAPTAEVLIETSV